MLPSPCFHCVPAPTPKIKTVHMKCAVSPDQLIPHAPFPVLHFSFPVPRSSFPVPSPGRSMTRARGLYVSSLANFRVSDPKHGASPKVPSRHPWLQGHSSILGQRMGDAAIAPWTAHMAGTPLPRERAYTVSLLCVVSTERCVIQVPYLPNFATLNVDTIKKAKIVILTG